MVGSVVGGVDVADLVDGQRDQGLPVGDGWDFEGGSGAAEVISDGGGAPFSVGGRLAAAVTASQACASIVRVMCRYQAWCSRTW